MPDHAQPKAGTPSQGRTHAHHPAGGAGRVMASGALEMVLAPEAGAWLVPIGHGVPGR